MLFTPWCSKKDHIVRELTKLMCVFDIYRDMSIKNVERTLQDDDQGLQLQNISEKQWKKLLRQSYNKARLIQFLLNVWKK